MKTGMDRFKAQIVPMVNAPASNIVLNASGYHLSYKPYCPNYGSETTALVLEGTVFLVLDGDHRDDMVAASRSGGLQACFNLFLDRIAQANRLSEHPHILSGDNLFGVEGDARRILGEANIDLLRAAVTPSIPNHEELETMRRTSEDGITTSIRPATAQERVGFQWGEVPGVCWGRHRDGEWVPGEQHQTATFEWFIEREMVPALSRGAELCETTPREEEPSP